MAGPWGEKNPGSESQLGHCLDKAGHGTSAPEPHGVVVKTKLKEGVCLSPGDLPELGVGVIPTA